MYQIFKFVRYKVYIINILIKLTMMLFSILILSSSVNPVYVGGTTLINI